MRAMLLVLACGPAFLCAAPAAIAPASIDPLEPQSAPPVAEPAPVANTTPVSRLLTERMRDIRGLGGVQVRQYGGVVILEGEVVTEADRELAEKIARGGEGVRDVVNDIEISTSLRERLREASDESMRRLERFVGSAPLLLVSLVIVWLSWWLSSWLAERSWLGRPLRGNAFATEVLRHAIRIGGVLFGLVVALRLLDAVALAGALVGSAGVLGIALGFAFKDLIENYIASILLSLRQPFRPNDHVVIDGNEGVVVGLSSRATVLMTPAGNHLTLPNSLVFKAVMLNYTRNPKRRFEFSLVLGPETSSTLVLEHGLAHLRDVLGVLAEPGPSVSVRSAGRDSIEFLFLAWVDQTRSNMGRVRSEAIRRVRSGLRQRGVAFDGPVLHVSRGAVAAAEPEAPQSTTELRAPSEAEVLLPAVEATRAEMAGSDLLRTGSRSDF
jgi:small conductance mechanosensitive channel